MTSIKTKRTENDCLQDILKQINLHDWRKKSIVVGG